jgi:diaminopimelate epimerase
MRRSSRYPMFPRKANVTFAAPFDDEVAAREAHRSLALHEAETRGRNQRRAGGRAAGEGQPDAALPDPGGDAITCADLASDDHVLMTGPVEFEGERLLDAALFEAAL